MGCVDCIRIRHSPRKFSELSTIDDNRSYSTQDQNPGGLKRYSILSNAWSKIVRIGIDFDNTIVCYDKSIKKLVEEDENIPDHITPNKESVKEYLHSIGKNDQWTEFQGKIYGIGIDYAEPYQGAIETMENLKIKGHELFIVSHKSKRPYLGEKYDLHAAAKGWILK